MDHLTGFEPAFSSLEDYRLCGTRLGNESLFHSATDGLGCNIGFEPTLKDSQSSVLTVTLKAPYLKTWSLRSDLNRHALRRRVLSPLCIPVPPLSDLDFPVRFELTYADLQSAASPLGQEKMVLAERVERSLPLFQNGTQTLKLN